MADEDLDEETRAGFLVTTREQVERLTKLAADLLDLSRIDAGRLRVEREEVVLADVARDRRRGALAARGGDAGIASRSRPTPTPGRSPTRSACSRSAARWPGTR